MNNGAYLNPVDRVLSIEANINDVSIHQDGSSVLIVVTNLVDGIEIETAEDAALWWPVDRPRPAKKSRRG